MAILANAPPLPLSWKLTAALLMLALSSALLRLRFGQRFTPAVMMFAMVLAVIVVSALEALFPGEYGPGFHSRGVVAAIIGALSPAVCLRLTRRAPTTSHPARQRSLAAVSFVAGPAAGFVLGLAMLLLADIPRLDRTYTFTAYIVVGTLAGVIAAPLSAALTALPQRADRPDTADRD